MPVIIQLRGGTASEWTSANPTLFAREMGVETDTLLVKMGDGTSNWVSLPYFTQGVAGDSAYDIAVANGFVGTEPDWLATFGTNGADGADSTVPGPTGPTGPAGTNGTNGSTGPTGPAGADGADGSGVLSGIATLDFGSGSTSAQTTLTGHSGITANSVILVALRVIATAEHTAEDMLVDPIRVAVKDLVVGVGFTIDGRMDNAQANGTYEVSWVIIS
jgi:hypothetical protein